jgi:hypothetical protein
MGGMDVQQATIFRRSLRPARALATPRDSLEVQHNGFTAVFLIGNIDLLWRLRAWNNP